MSGDFDEMFGKAVADKPENEHVAEYGTDGSDKRGLEDAVCARDLAEGYDRGGGGEYGGEECAGDKASPKTRFARCGKYLDKRTGFHEHRRDDQAEEDDRDILWQKTMRLASRPVGLHMNIVYPHTCFAYKVGVRMFNKGPSTSILVFCKILE